MKIHNNTQIGIIGLKNVDIDMLVSNAFLNKKLAMSNIGQRITNKHKIFCVVNPLFIFENFFINLTFVLPIL